VDSSGGTIDTTFVPSVAGSYIAIVTYGAGCLDTSSAVVVDSIVTPSVSISINTSDTICQNQQVNFFAVGTNGGSNPDYQWIVNGLNVGNSPTYIATTILNGDIYSCVLTSTALCATSQYATSDSITFTVNPYPNVVISTSSPCTGDSVVLTASGGSTYLWSNGGSTSSISASVGTYTVTATDNNGCTAATLYDLQPYTPLTDSLAQSNDTLVLISSGTGEFYQWYLNDSIINGAIGTSYFPTQSGAYQVSVIDSQGCLSSSGAVYITEAGINTIEADPTVRIYPNPNSGIFTLVSADALPHMVTITDATGRKVMDNVTFSHEQQFDLTSLTDGIYYLRVSDSKTTKLLKLNVVR